MIMIINKCRGFKEHSHQSKESISDQQRRHKRDIIQPRDRDGEINPEYVQVHGAKNLNPTSHDIYKMSKKSSELANILAKKTQ